MGRAQRNPSRTRNRDQDDGFRCALPILQHRRDGIARRVTLGSLPDNKREALMAEENGVLVAREGAVPIISINRPHCRNAVDGATARKLYDAFLAFDADKDASVAVFTGTGGYFCAGADLKKVAAGDPEKKRELGGFDSIAPMGPSRLRLSKPVIGAVGGVAG